MTKKKTKDLAANDLPKFSEVDAFLQPIKNDAEASLDVIRQLVLKTPAEREFAANALKEFAHRHDTTDAKRLSWVKPLKAVTSDIDATFRPVLKAFKEGVQILKSKIAAYDVAQAHARRAELQRAEIALQQGDVKGAGSAIVSAEAHVVEHQMGQTSKIYWTGEVTNPDDIPREFCIPDVKKLEALTKALGADPKIPGWRAFETAEVRTTRKGVAS